MSIHSKRVSKPSRKVFVTSLSLASVLALTYPSMAAKVYAAGNKYEWVKHVDQDLLNGHYSSVASSGSGQHLLMGVNDGGEGYSAASPLFISSDYGTTWENIDEDIEDNMRNSWTSVDISNNGQKMVAASEYTVDLDSFYEDEGQIFVSQNAGNTWSNVSPNDAEDWHTVVISGDGTTIAAIATDDTDNLYTSINGGSTWQTSAVPNVNHWESLSISDDGDTVLVGGENNTTASPFVYISENSGTNWDDITPASGGMGFAAKTALTDDGSKIVASVYGYDGGDYDTVYLSENKGDNWTDISPDDADDNYWEAIAISGNGSVLSVLDDDDKMYISSDDGANWTEEDPDHEDDGDNEWVSADFNTSGSRMVVASELFAYSSYNANHAVEPETENSAAAVNFVNAESGKAIKLVTPDGTTITCHSPVKESALVVKDGAYSYPLGLVDFCFSGADASNEIKLTFVTDLKPNQVAVRKHNPKTSSYATITGATVTETTYNGQHALQVAYNVADNGPLDTNPTVGEVADPVGLGILDVGAPNTGLSQDDPKLPQATWIISASLAASLVATPVRRKILNYITPKK